MKYLPIFTALSIVVVVVSIIFSSTTIYKTSAPKSVPYNWPQFDSVKTVLNQMQEHSFDTPGDTISKKEYVFHLNHLQDKLEDYQLETKLNKVSPSETGFSAETFWMKVIFSSIFCLAALFVILSQKYDDETKKWAFSVLTLIAGVWIGTITQTIFGIADASLHAVVGVPANDVYAPSVVPQVIK